MSASTPKYGISYLQGGDQFHLIDEWTQVIAERLDLLLGESGVVNIGQDTVDTTKSVRVNYSRSYAGTGPNPPRVLCVLNDGPALANDFRVWATAEDNTGFTINVRGSQLTTREYRWICKPRGN